jgi:hypothetical protein
MQRKILVREIRNVYFRSIAKREFFRSSNANPTPIGEQRSLLASILASIPATNLFYMRPKATLPLGAGAFNDEKGIGEAYRIGWNRSDAKLGGGSARSTGQAAGSRAVAARGLASGAQVWPSTDAR